MRNQRILRFVLAIIPPICQYRDHGKGSDAQANYIVSNIAERNCIPVVENVELALLFFEVERDKIPETLFEPVAALLRIDEDRLRDTKHHKCLWYYASSGHCEG